MGILSKTKVFAVVSVVFVAGQAVDAQGWRDCYRCVNFKCSIGRSGYEGCTDGHGTAHYCRESGPQNCHRGPTTAIPSTSGVSFAFVFSCTAGENGKSATT